MKLWLDDVRDPKKYGRVGWTWVRTLAQAKDVLQTGEVVRASLDHDLGGAFRDAAGRVVYPDGMSPDGTGYDLVVWMAENDHWPTDGVDVHSANKEGAARMLSVVRERFPAALWVTGSGAAKEDQP